MRFASLLRGLRKLDRLVDLGLEPGDSPGVVGLDCMGERDRPPAEGRMFNSLGRLELEVGCWLAGVEEVVRPAVEETVETKEGGGEGVTDLEGGAGVVLDGGGAGGGLSSVLRLGRERVELTELESEMENL